MRGVSFPREFHTLGAVAAALVVVAACLAGCMPCGECSRCQPPAANPAASVSPPREFAIEGMTCEGCVQTITAALKAIPGVTSAEVSLQDKKATVVADEAQVPASKIEAAVSQAGYKATALQASSSP